MNKTKVNRIGYDRFGMPSGHAQATFYVTGFMFFIMKNKWIPIVFIVVSLITLYQRVKYKNHTIEQVIIGSIVGIAVGFVFSIVGKNVASGTIC
jgi:membrane-associated phospholipid phosphatase